MWSLGGWWREETSFIVHPFEFCVIGLYYLVQKILCVGLSKKASSFQICYTYYQNQALYHQRNYPLLAFSACFPCYI